MSEPTFAPFPPSPDTIKKHSRIGIASFVASLAGVLIFCLALLISMGYGVSIAGSDSYAGQNPFRAIDQSAPIFVVAVILSWCGPLLNLVGVGLGIAAIIQKNEKKTFGIVGLVISGLVLITFCLLTIIGTVGQLASF